MAAKSPDPFAQEARPVDCPRVPPDPDRLVRTYLDAFADLVIAWEALPEERRLGLVPPPGVSAPYGANAFGLTFRQRLRPDAAIRPDVTARPSPA